MRGLRTIDTNLHKGWGEVVQAVSHLSVDETSVGGNRVADSLSSGREELEQVHEIVPDEWLTARNCDMPPGHGQRLIPVLEIQKLLKLPVHLEQALKRELASGVMFLSSACIEGCSGLLCATEEASCEGDKTCRCSFHPFYLFRNPGYDSHEPIIQVFRLFCREGSFGYSQ